MYTCRSWLKWNILYVKRDLKIIINVYDVIMFMYILFL